jgi:hypothetical protein
MVVAVETGAELALEAPRSLFAGPYFQRENQRFRPHLRRRTRRPFSHDPARRSERDAHVREHRRGGELRGRDQATHAAAVTLP